MQFQIFKKWNNSQKLHIFCAISEMKRAIQDPLVAKRQKFCCSFRLWLFWKKLSACSQCDYAYSDPSALKTHLKNAQWTKSSKCNQYNFQSFRSDNLRIHLKTHRGEKPNKCNQCDYACSDPSTLRTHLKTHIGEKFYKCNQCNYAPP